MRLIELSDQEQERLHQTIEKYGRFVAVTERTSEALNGNRKARWSICWTNSLRR
jgi:hypothetical protein